MSLTINSNQGATISLRALQRSQAALERALHRLSTGQNAPTARFDAAGLAMSSRIRGEIVSLQKQQLIAQQGVAMLQIAEGSYQNTFAILTRMRSLASQAQGSNISSTERGMLDTEYQQLKAEITRLARNTGIGGTNLFDTGNISLAAYSNQVSIPGSTNASTEQHMFDFNGDGHADILSLDLNFANQVQLRLGNGDGTFGTAQNTAMPAAFTQLAVGDFNGDGIKDFAVGNGTTIATYINNGSGGFTQGVSYAGNATSDLAAGDFNGDGKDDLAYSVANTITVAINNLSGFTATSHTVAGHSNAQLLVGDMNNDGYADIVTNDISSNRTGRGTNSGNGSFSFAATTNTGGTKARGSLYDMNGDGFLDLITSDTASNNVTIFLNNGTSYSSTTAVSMGATQTQVYGGDINGDGIADLIIASTVDGISYRQGSASLTFSTAQNLVAAGPYTAEVKVTDINRDGRLDVVAFSYINDNENRIGTYLNQSTMGLEGTIRVGPNAAAINNVSFRTGSSRLNSLDNEMEHSMINSIGAAKRAEAAIRRASETLTLFRTNAAAAQNRLENIQTNLSNIVENQEGARSAIADLDVAREMTEFTAAQILQQAGIAMLSQSRVSQEFLLNLIN